MCKHLKMHILWCMCLCSFGITGSVYELLVTIYTVESEIEYRPPSIIGRVYKICTLLGQLQNYGRLLRTKFGTNDRCVSFEEEQQNRIDAIIWGSVICDR